MISLDFLPLRLRFLYASSPSYPNIFLIYLGALSFLGLTLISCLWRIASIGVIFDAFLAGIKAEIKIVNILTRIIPMIAQAGTTVFICILLSFTPAIIPVEMILWPTNFSVMPIPKIPAKIPTGIPIAPKIAPSKYTLFRFCDLVAPTDASIPRYLTRSESDIPKAL